MQALAVRTRLVLRDPGEGASVDCVVPADVEVTARQLRRPEARRELVEVRTVVTSRHFVRLHGQTRADLDERIRPGGGRFGRRLAQLLYARPRIGNAGGRDLTRQPRVKAEVALARNTLPFGPGRVRRERVDCA